jgi:predicted dehydrogenase
VKSVLLCGLGSIGQRHARNLRQLYGPAVRLGAFRERGLSGAIRDDLQGFEEEPVEKRYNIEVFTDLAGALRESWDAVFITNPIHRHLPVALEAARAGFPLLIEKPLGSQWAEAQEFARVCAEKRLPVMVAFQLRFHPLLASLKQRLAAGELGRVLHAAFHFGEYLPGMHPYEDYRESHMARREQGGGVIHCLSHELDLALWLAGTPRRVFAHGGKLTGLEHDVEDFVQLSAEVVDGNNVATLVDVHLNFWQRPPRRHFSLTTEAATIDFDYIKASLVIRHREKPEEVHTLMPFVRNQMFLDELQHFAECVRLHREPQPGLADGLRALQFALAAHESLATRREVTL